MLSLTSKGFGLHKNKALRRAAFGLLTPFQHWEATIGHHWVDGAKVRLNVVKHRGYWYHGRGRERAVMASMAHLIQPGDTVVEVGGHIGYISLYLADLVGPDGRVFVFEPSPQNLQYLQRNVAHAPQVTVVQCAVSDRIGQASFYTEDLSGQNSTLVRDYGNLAQNASNAFRQATYSETRVKTTTLDAFVEERGIRPSFVKIDIEGAELLALHGMSRCLESYRPQLMVEVTEQEDAVMALLKDADYLPYDHNLMRFGRGSNHGPNRFFLPRELAWA